MTRIPTTRFPFDFDLIKVILLASFGLGHLHVIKAQTLNYALLQDLFPPKSKSCKSPDTFSFQFKPDDWHEEFEPAEKRQFLFQMNHEDKNPDRSWSMRIGTGGHCYSLKGPFGEVIPDQIDLDSLWNDAVLQSVAVNTQLNNAGKGDWFIHQAGPYQRADGLTKTIPFYSPNLAAQCTREWCAVGGWGQQAHIPTVFKSDVLFFTRYSDCGDGVIEVTNVIINAADPDSPEAAKVNWLNTFWGGFKTSVLQDFLLSDAQGRPHIQYPLQLFGRTENEQEFRRQELNIPYVYDTGGYAVFAEDLRIPPSDNLNKFNMPCSKDSPDDCVELVIKADNSCMQSMSHTNRYTVRCAIEFTSEVDHGCENCHLYFTNRQTGKGFEVPHVAHWSIMGRMIYFSPRNLSAQRINQLLHKGNVVDVGYSTKFRMPCIDTARQRIKECSIDPEVYAREVLKLVVAEDDSCQYSSYHTDKNERKTVRMKLKNTHNTKEGCDTCKLKFINKRTKEEIGVGHVSHWAFPGQKVNYIYFVPMKDTAEQINNKFKKGDTIIIENLDNGKPLGANRGISVVYGKEPEDLPSDYNRETRLRYGATFFKKDFTIFVHNPRIDLLPCESFVSRHYLLVDRLGNIRNKSMKWVDEAYKDHYSCGEFSGRSVHLYSDGTRFGYRFNSNMCGNAILHCSGKTVPEKGLIAHFFIKCGRRTYMGPDKYYFAPKRSNQRQPIRSYFCRDQPGIVPEWKLLGYYPRGSCKTLFRVKYDETYCKTASQ